MEENKELIKREEGAVREGLFPTARALFKSGIFPNVKNEYGAFAVVQYGQELGIGPMTALQTMGIINGKICMAGQVMLSIALRNGVQYKIIKDTDTECQVSFKKAGLEYLSSFSIEEAKKAGIYKAQSGWEKYPRDMLFWRAVTRGLRRVCPDAILGLYAKEEIEDAPPINGEIVVEEQPPRQSKDFDFLKKMDKAKVTLGAEKYYNILYPYTYGHATEVKDENKEAILKEMRDKYLEMNKEKNEAERLIERNP